MIFDLLDRRGTAIAAKTPAPHDDYWYTDLGTGPAATGDRITPETALRASAVMACVKVLAETIASLPLHVYRRLPDGAKERAPDERLYEVLHAAPNQSQTSFEFREMMQGHLALRGNAYAEIVSNRGTDYGGLIPLHPDRVHVRRSTAGRLVYEVKAPPELSLETGIPRVRQLWEDQVLHVKGLSSDGIVGISPIQAAQNAIALALATEQHGARLFKNRAFPGGVLQHPGSFKDKETAGKVARSFQKAYSGTNAHAVAVLEEGMTWQAMGMTSEDAQFLETRKYQVTDIARIFRVPPHMIGDLERATFSNIEHQAIEFVVHTIRPWVVRWEQALTRALLIGDEEHFIEFALEGLLRGDAKARGEYYRLMRETGEYSVNDVLRLENMNPIGEEGDLRHVPARWKVLEITEDEPEEPVPAPFQQQPGPPPPGTPPDEDETEDEDGAAAFAQTIGVFIEDAAERIAAAELRGVGQRFERKPNDAWDEFNVWLDAFCDKQRIYIGCAVAPIVRAWEGQGGSCDGAHFCESIIDSGRDDAKERWENGRKHGRPRERTDFIANRLKESLSMQEAADANAA